MLLYSGFVIGCTSPQIQNFLLIGARNGFSKAIRRKKTFENGYSPMITSDVWSWRILIFKATLNIKFIDLLNFIPMRWANFPKTFGIEELEKGYFPHLFNRKENENYFGPILTTPYYNPNGMSPKDREAFLAWHASKKESNYVFNFNDKILSYCRYDVDILCRCGLEFPELFHEITDIDPFRAKITSDPFSPPPITIPME